MKETGILFTPANHRLILSGVEIQTRRVMNPQPCMNNMFVTQLEDNEGGPDVWQAFEPSTGWTKEDFDICEPEESFHKCLFGHVGDLLYIKEGIILHADGETLAGYYMDGARVTNLGEKRLTAMFMAKRYARTWLELTDVRVERLQDISEEDALAEGIVRFGREFTFNGGLHLSRTAKDSYRALWDSINRTKHPWENNDWVWVLEFRKL